MPATDDITETIPDLADATARPPAGVKITTPGEFAAAWNRNDQAGRQRMLTSILDAMDARLDCFLDDHVAKLEWWDTHAGALGQIAAERTRQNEKWGEQNHPDGTGPTSMPLYSTREFLDDARSAQWIAQLLTNRTNRRAAVGTVTWRDILLEEVFEALAEDDPTALRTELIQVAAVATQWVEAIDRRTPHVEVPC